MSRLTISLLASTVLWSGAAIVGSTVIEFIAPAKLLAQQIVYPSTSDPNGVMVTGQGIAKTSADVAEIRFLVSGVDPEAADVEARPVENNAGKPSSGKTKPQVTEASLQPIVTAIAATGVPTSAIQVSIDAANSNRPYGRPLRSNATGTIRVTLEKPSQRSVQTVVEAGDNAAKTARLFTQQYLQYRLNDCATLEKAAYTAAVNDAQRRAQAIASATGVQLADHPSIAEAFYATFYPSACNPSNKSFYPTIGDPFYSAGFSPYSPNIEATVETRKDLFVTYKMK